MALRRCFPASSSVVRQYRLQKLFHRSLHTQSVDLPDDGVCSIHRCYSLSSEVRHATRSPSPSGELANPSGLANHVARKNRKPRGEGLPASTAYAQTPLVSFFVIDKLKQLACSLFPDKLRTFFRKMSRIPKNRFVVRRQDKTSMRARTNCRENVNKPRVCLL